MKAGKTGQERMMERKNRTGRDDGTEKQDRKE